VEEAPDLRDGNGTNTGRESRDRKQRQKRKNEIETESRDGNGTDTGTEEKYAEKGTGTSGDRAFEKGVSGHGMLAGL
jgi:hypothetical protein